MPAPLGVERSQSTAERGILERTGFHGRSAEAREGLVLKERRPEVVLVVDEAQAVEDHRLDRMAGGDKPHGRLVRGDSIKDLGEAKFFKHPRDQTQGIEDLRAVRLGRWRDVRAV